ncbi:MAG: hypothetical protein JNL08_17430 [Planctomycetes bacterium]|nr:hypothetical protein [Planctomycetota bacterium]
MKAPLQTLLTLFALLTPALAQSPAKLKKELKAKEAAAKTDVEALFQAAQWAAEKELAADAKRIYQAVLKLKPDHEGANLAVGNEQVDGKWVPAKEAEDLRKKARAAEFAAKGWVESNGLWIAPEHAEDAKKGIFHDGDDRVTKEELAAVQKGMVRHPVTGELIEPRYRDQAEKRYFPTSASRWVDEKEANQFHSDLKRPWIVRTQNCTVLSTLPIAKIEEVRGEADVAFERMKSMFGGAMPLPQHRPVVLIAATESEYRDLGNGLGDGTDAAGSALIREEAKLQLQYLGEVRGAICNHHKDWGPRYLRHAAALCFVHALAEENSVTLPLWFLHGAAAYTSRFQVDSDAGWFGKLHQQKGGVRALKSFFSAYTISGDMESTQIDYNIYGAGLLFSFALSGADEAVNGAFKEVVDLLTGASKAKADKAIAKLEAAFVAAEPKIAAHLQELIKKSPQ